jgi:hypothetical protein|tara:strand:- start:972 stop:1220 length:249 start_codon:yes stop_codon:yes gene_type:complete
MITEIILGLVSLIILTSSFSCISVWGVKILYAEKLKELKEYKKETLNIIELRCKNLELENKKDDEEYKTLTILKNDLINIKD